MEKTTKKKKAKKGLKKRIGLIAIGGLSLVLTVCLSVGATLAWFAGSTHADQSLFMGGPVYVEMTGETDTGTWQGGSGHLDMEANGNSGVLLPGSRFTIFSQARVFSTSTSDTTDTDNIKNTSNGANTSNTSDAAIGGEHKTQKGNKTTATNSVLRARFSVNVEFDPIAGFNNFTAESYSKNYPVQSGAYKGDVGDGTSNYTVTTTPLAWTAALGAKKLTADDDLKYESGARRDAVDVTDATSGAFTADTSTDLTAIKNGTETSIYSWKFVSKKVYNDTSGVTVAAGSLSDATTGTGVASGKKYVQMGAPFDGSAKVSGTDSVYYGVWILDGDGEAQHLKESDSFYKARCNNYIQTYVEHYPTEYGDFTTRTVGESLQVLEEELNESLTKLVNDSSNAIIAGYLQGFTADANGNITYKPNGETHSDPMETETDYSWLYIDPKIGNDTNTNELSTSKGGWWYLVECDNGLVGDFNLAGIEQTGTAKDTNKVKTVTDSAVLNITESSYDRDQTNSITTGESFTRHDIGYECDNTKDSKILNAKLAEIKPTSKIGDAMRGTDAEGNAVYKVASYQFPFVNGVVTLDGKSITNVFANAKITIQVAFQAVQAFFPFTTSIDGLTYKDALLGTAKALNIKNAIPIFNEAFDYGA